MPYRLAIAQYSKATRSLQIVIIRCAFDYCKHFFTQILTCSFPALRAALFPPPCAGHEQHQHGIELQAAREHVKYEDVLSRNVEEPVVGGRADEGQAGADVVERGGDGREIRLEVCLLKEADQQDREDQDEDIGAQIGPDTPDHLSVRRLAVHLDRADAARVDESPDLALHGLGEDDDT